MRSRVRRRSRWLAILCALATIWIAAPARADVGVRGEIQYWDARSNTWKPARRVMVEFEGDWWWRADPQFRTDDNGRFEYRGMGNPPFGDYDGVDVEAYTKNVFGPDFPYLPKIKQFMVAWYAYNVTSQPIENVGDDQMLTMNVRIGPPMRTPPANYRWCVGDDGVCANAFRIYDSMIEHIDTLERRVGRGRIPAETVGVFPGLPSNSCYNPVLGFMFLSDAASSEAARPGLRAFDSVKHEMGHRYHDFFGSLLTAPGLFMGGTHSFETESNRFMAFTEAFAEFQHAFSDPSEADLEPTNPSWFVNCRPPIVMHDHCEGEVASVLWDLYDSNDNTLGPTEEIRNRNTAIPAAIPQKWMDRVADPDLAGIWRTVATPGLERIPWTINEFIADWLAAHPEQRHDVKVICYNRGITRDAAIPAQYPPQVSGLAVARNDSRFTVRGTATESDPEDRPYVRLQLWYQADDRPPQPCGGPVVLGPDFWEGSSRTFELSGQVSHNAGGYSLRDDLDPSRRRIAWVVVDDEIQYAAQTVGVPADQTGPVDLGGFRVSNAWRQELPPPAPAAPDPRAAMLRESAATVVVTRAGMQALDSLLEERGEICERILRQARGLYKVAVALGALKDPGPVPLPDRLTPRADGKGFEPWDEPRELQEWEWAVIKGGGVPRRLRPAEVDVIKEALDLSIRQRDRLGGMAKEIDALGPSLAQKIQSLPLTELDTDGPNVVTAERAVADVLDVTKLVLSDQDAPRRLELQIQVLEALLKGTGDVPLPGPLEPARPPQVPEKQPWPPPPEKQPLPPEGEKPPVPAPPEKWIPPEKQPPVLPPEKQPWPKEPEKQPPPAPPEKWVPSEKAPPPAKEPEKAPPAQPAGTKVWGFEVLGAKHADSYNEQYCKDARQLFPVEKGHRLLVLACRLTNRTREDRIPCLTERLPGSTSVFDATGAGYKPLDYDAPQMTGKMQDYAALPVPGGASADLVLVFSVPADFVPARLVFTILRYPDDVGGKGTDVEVRFEKGMVIK